MRAVPRTSAVLSLLLVFGLAGAAGCVMDLDDVGATRAAAVYGADDRLEFYEARPAEQAHVRRSVLALIEEWRVDASNPEDVQILSERPVDLGVCAEHPYSRQPAAAFCTATLIDDDLVLTAGHCAVDPGFCASTLFVFDYYYQAEGRPARVTADALYRCAEIVDTEFTVVGAADWAVIRLERPVSADRRPVAVQRAHRNLDGESVWGAGFSLGTPAKVRAGDVVRSYAGDRFYQMRMDVDWSDSGTGYLDESGILIGILSGQPVPETRETCEIGRLFPDDEEDPYSLTFATSADLALAAVCEAGNGGARLCDPPAPMDSEPDGTPLDSPADGFDEAEDEAPLADAAPVAAGCAAAGFAGSTGQAWALPFLVALCLVWRRRSI